MTTIPAGASISAAPLGTLLPTTATAYYSAWHPIGHLAGADHLRGGRGPLGRHLNGEPIRMIEEHFQVALQFGDLAPLRITHHRWLIGDPDPDPRTSQQRALPRPSSTPPMWANDPTRSRRNR